MEHEFNVERTTVVYILLKSSMMCFAIQVFTMIKSLVSSFGLVTFVQRPCDLGNTFSHIH